MRTTQNTIVPVMSGIGVRPYYRRLGYSLHPPYMRKDLA